MNLLFFDFGSGEILLIVLAIFLVFGPGKIPELARGLGKFINEIKRASEDVKTEINREANRIDREKKREAFQQQNEEEKPEEEEIAANQAEKKEEVKTKPKPKTKSKPGPKAASKTSSKKKTTIEKKQPNKKTGTAPKPKAKPGPKSRQKAKAKPTKKASLAEAEATQPKKTTLIDEIKITPAENTVSTKR